MNKSLIRIFYWDGVRKIRLHSPFHDPLVSILKTIKNQINDDNILTTTLYI